MVTVPSYIEALSAYEPGKSIREVRERTGVRTIIKLASNENPFGPSPKAKAAILAAAANAHRYSCGGFPLRAKLAKKYNVTPEQVALGNGSDSLMLAIVRAYLTEGSEVVTSECSFPQYYLMPKSRGATVKAVPMKNFTYDLAAIAAAVTPKTRLIFLANPNNPTGRRFIRKFRRTA